MKRRPTDQADIVAPAELAAGPRLDLWCDPAELAALASIPVDHPHRADAVRQVKHAAWMAYRRALAAWLADTGHDLRTLRKAGLLRFRAPYVDAARQATRS